MDEKLYLRLDAASAALLLLWAGMAGGLVLLAAPLISDRILLAMLWKRLDLAAWVAFGGAFLVSYGARWLHELKDSGEVGPMRLWSAAALLALLMCFASAFIAVPKLQVAASGVPGLGRAQSVHYQLLAFRFLLAAALAAGLSYLPRCRPEL